MNPYQIGVMLCDLKDMTKDMLTQATRGTDRMGEIVDIMSRIEEQNARQLQLLETLIEHTKNLGTIGYGVVQATGAAVEVVTRDVEERREAR